MIKKTIALLALFSCSLAFADETPRFYVINDFSKGLNSQISIYRQNENQGEIAKNVRFNKVFSGVAKRSVNLTYGSAGSHSIEGMHRYYKTSNGTKKLIVTGSTFAYVGNDTTGAFQTIGQGYTDGKRWQFVTYKDIAIGMNGFEQPIKYDAKTDVTDNTDGHRTASDVVTELGAPFAELNTGSNLDASSWYQYKIAFYDGTTYSFSTARSNPLKTGATVRNISLTDIPLGPTGTTQRIIYRTVGDASRALVLADTSYYRVATISNNTARTYNDTLDDATLLADTAPTWATASAGTNVTPPLGKYAIIHDERLFTSGNDTNKSDVYWSDSFNPDYFDPEDFIQVRPDDGDEVTFLREQLGILTIGKTNTIQKFYTDGGTSQWSISDPFSFVGCPAPYSVANTPLGIFYLARNGIYRFTGQSTELISDAVTPQILDILASNIGKAAGYYFNNEYHLSYTSSDIGGTLNNRVLVYDIVRDAYALDTKSINVFEAFDSGDDFGVLYHGSSLDDGNIYADEGSPNVIAARFKSDFEDGTFDDTRTAGADDAGHPHLPVGTEKRFWVELAWDLTINNMVGDINSQIGIIDRPDTDGTWESPVYEIDASQLEQIQWNETLGAFGDVTFQVRTCDTVAGCAAEAYSSAFTNPNGSDLTGLTAKDFVQIRANLSTTNIEETPTIYPSDNYVWRMFYKKAGQTPEPDFHSTWQSGRLNFGIPGYKKFIRRIRVFYKSDEGIINFTYKNDQGDVDRDFDIDMAVDPTTTNQDDYRGTREVKYYTHYPPPNSDDDPGPTGEYWILQMDEEGADEWAVYKVEIEYYPEEIFD